MTDVITGLLRPVSAAAATAAAVWSETLYVMIVNRFTLTLEAEKLRQ